MTFNLLRTEPRPDIIIPEKLIFRLHIHRFWLDAASGITPHDLRIHRMTFSHGKAVELKVIAVGEDDGYWFDATVDFMADKEDPATILAGTYKKPELAAGPVDMVPVFDPESDPQLYALFDEHRMEIPLSGKFQVEKSGTSLTIRLQHGRMAPTAMDFLLEGSVSGDLEDLDNLKTEGDNLRTYLWVRKKGYVWQINVRQTWNTRELIPDEPHALRIYTHLLPVVIRAETLQIRQYNLLEQNFSEAGIRFSYISGEGLAARWAEHFHEGLDVGGIGEGEFPWHVFSRKKRPALEGDAARAGLNVLNAPVLFLFFYDPFQETQKGPCYRLENAGGLRASMLEGLEEMYVVNEDFSATYVLTHESGCGPYFSDKEMTLTT